MRTRPGGEVAPEAVVNVVAIVRGECDRGCGKTRSQRRRVCSNIQRNGCLLTRALRLGPPVATAPRRSTHAGPRFPPSRLFGRLPPCIPSRRRLAGIRKPLTIAAVCRTSEDRRRPPAGIPRIAISLRAGRSFLPAPPSPASTNGAQTSGWANSDRLFGSSMAISLRRSASARPIVGSFFTSSKAPIINLTVATEATDQCDTRIDRAPA